MSKQSSEGLSFLAGGGEMGALTRAYDWEKTPLGPPRRWPQSLRTTVRLLLNTNHPMFIWWGPELIQFYNDAYRQTMGAERHPSALGQRGRECWEEIWDIIGPQIEQVMSGRGATWHEDQLVPVTRHGRREQVWWTYGYSPIDDDESGGIGGVLVVCNDVTREHLANEALKAERAAVEDLNRRLAAETEFLRGLFLEAPSFMAVLRGPDHVFELANAAYMQLIGHRDIIGKRLAEALPEIGAQGFIALLDRVRSTGEPFVGRRHRALLQRTAGAPLEERFIDFVYQPIKAAGAVRGIFVEGVDITERVAAEEGLRRLTETLEEKVEARTTELRRAEEALHQAQKMEAVGQLTGGIAHDFNNLLTVIAGQIDLIERLPEAGERLRQLTAAAQRAIERGARLTGQLLAFSRRQTLVTEIVKVDRVIADFATMIERALGETVTLVLRSEGALWPCEIDPAMFEAAMLNLAINARDAMDSRGKLVIATRNLALDAAAAAAYPGIEPGRYVVVTVADTGRGMPPEIAARAFEPFFTTKGPGLGSGLGLSQIYGFVRQSGGHIRLDSREGAGTTITMLFPATTRQSAVRAHGKRAHPSRHGKTATILVAEDDADVLAIVEATLSEAGHRVLAAQDASQALAMLGRENDIDLLFTDIVMPHGITGLELARRAQRLRPGLRVLLTSGYTGAELSRLGGLSPFELIRKPFRQSELVSRVAAILG